MICSEYCTYALQGEDHCLAIRFSPVPQLHPSQIRSDDAHLAEVGRPSSQEVRFWESARSVLINAPGSGDSFARKVSAYGENCRPNWSPTEAAS